MPILKGNLSILGYEKGYACGRPAGSNRVDLLLSGYAHKSVNFIANYDSSARGYQLASSTLDNVTMQKVGMVYSERLSTLNGESISLQGAGTMVTLCKTAPGKVQVMGHTRFQAGLAQYERDGFGEWQQISQAQGHEGIARRFPQTVRVASSMARFLDRVLGISLQRGERKFDDASITTLTNAGIVLVPLTLEGYVSCHATVQLKDGRVDDTKTGYEFALSAVYQNGDHQSSLTSERNLPAGTHSLTVQYSCVQGLWVRDFMSGTISTSQETREMDPHELEGMVNRAGADDFLDPNSEIAQKLDLLATLSSQSQDARFEQSEVVRRLNEGQLDDGEIDDVLSALGA